MAEGSPPAADPPAVQMFALGGKHTRPQPLRPIQASPLWRKGTASSCDSGEISLRSCVPVCLYAPRLGVDRPQKVSRSPICPVLVDATLVIWPKLGATTFRTGLLYCGQLNTLND